MSTKGLSDTYKQKQLRDFVYMFKDEIEKINSTYRYKSGKSDIRSSFLKNIASYFLSYFDNSSSRLWKLIVNTLHKLPVNYKIVEFI